MEPITMVDGISNRQSGESGICLARKQSQRSKPNKTCPRKEYPVDHQSVASVATPNTIDEHAPKWTLFSTALCWLTKSGDKGFMTAWWLTSDYPLVLLLNAQYRRDTMYRQKKLSVLSLR
jgi:hypothetical protein